ncbi:MAG TPA: glycosyltransferase family 39 protein [Pyrinomonadaceae bacterium]|jgi:4-amino-4-deoxy-L-arabinose transferase-like glycosyltransferase|nr:glycosyltransferase family 39 protein [Pyrinomonadaceae bacterium]
MEQSAPREPTAEAPDGGAHAPSQPRRPETRRKLLAFALVFAAAFCVRLLCWQDARAEARAVQWAVTENYKQQARLFDENGAPSFFTPGSPTNDPDLLGHPPGYPFVLALVYKLFGGSDASVQVFQIVCDSLAAALVLLIAAELLPFAAAVTAGALAALAPQFCWNSILLLPDTLSVLPALLAVLLLLRADRGRAIASAAAAGVLIGLSCWLRANALLLAPFLALAVPLLFARGVRVRVSLALVAGALAAVAPLTVRNAVVFGEFIPVSIGSGQTLIEGIGDYDPEERFGLPDTDVELQRQEAELYGRPDYAASLFGPDAVARDGARRARAFSVIRAHPFWFASVMARRAASMLSLERVPLASNAVPVSGGWTRPLRLTLRAAQRLFVTAVFLPLYALGLFLLARERRTRALAALAAVPLYYLCVQSALHTEYRYVLAIQYFLLVPAALALGRAGSWARGKWSGRRG